MCRIDVVQVEDGSGGSIQLPIDDVMAELLVLPGPVPELLLQVQLTVSRVQNLHRSCTTSCSIQTKLSNLHHNGWTKNNLQASVTFAVVDVAHGASHNVYICSNQRTMRRGNQFYRQERQVSRQWAISWPHRLCVLRTSNPDAAAGVGEQAGSGHLDGDPRAVIRRRHPPR